MSSSQPHSDRWVPGRVLVRVIAALDIVGGPMKARGTAAGDYELALESLRALDVALGRLGVALMRYRRIAVAVGTLVVAVLFAPLLISASRQGLATFVEVALGAIVMEGIALLAAGSEKTYRVPLNARLRRELPVVEAAHAALAALPAEELARVEAAAEEIGLDRAVLMLHVSPNFRVLLGV